MSKQTQKIAFQFACFEKLLYLRHAPFPYRGGFLAGARLVLTQSSLRKYVRVLQNICKQRDFLPTAPSVASDYREPSSPTYRYEPRRNSGIRGWSLRTEVALGNAVSEGLHTLSAWFLGSL